MAGDDDPRASSPPPGEGGRTPRADNTMEVLLGDLEEAADDGPSSSGDGALDGEPTHHRSRRSVPPTPTPPAETSPDGADDEVDDLLTELQGELAADAEAARPSAAPPPLPPAVAPRPSEPPAAPPETAEQRAPSVPPPLPGPGAPRSSHAPRTASSSGFEKDALALVHACEDELSRTDDPRRAALLHFEVARLAESALGDLRRAAAHYAEALERNPEHLPTIRGARRVWLARKQAQQALPLFDAEARITADPRQKAALFHRKGRVLEDVLKQRDAARHAYATALELDRSDAGILKAMEQAETDAGHWDDLSRTFEREANAVARDPAHRAAIIVERARLVEHRRGDVETAIELYETALKLDPTVHGAIEALERLHGARRRWRDLIRVLLRKADLSDDPGVQGMALYEVGRLHGERLGNRDEAVAALEKAVRVLPDEPVVLTELARLYESAERWSELASVLERLVQLQREPSERVGLLDRLGEVAGDRLGDEDAAVHWYEMARELDPGDVPTLQALGKLHARRGDWEALLRMHLAEADATDDPRRRAAAHARMAELLETRLDRSDEAVEHHERAFALVPGYPPSEKALSRLLAEKGRWRELVDLYERVVEASDDRERRITHLFKIGAILEDAVGEPAQAAHAYRRVLDLDADHLGAIHALQRATERAGRYRELVDALELEAEKTRDQGHVVALVHRSGEVLDEQLGDRDGAIARFRRALRVDPKHVPSLTSLGRIYYRAGRWDDLLEMYQQELDLTSPGPRAAAILQKMGELCDERIGREEEALGYWRRAIELDPDFVPAQRSLARKLRERGEWEELVRVLELELEGLREPAARARANHRIGVVYEERLGQPDQAIAAHEAALRAEGDYRPSIQALARLRGEQRAWSALVEELDRDEKSAPDERAAAAAALRQGEVWSEELNEPRRAIACFERVLTRSPDHRGALLQLERLYRRVGNWEALARVLETEARIFTDDGARIAALRERARLVSTRGVGDESDLRRCAEAILELNPEDRGALEDLEALALASRDRTLLGQVDQRLAAQAAEPAVAAVYLTRLAESLESSGDVGGAMATYRQALEANPSGLAATRGLSRLAERLDDPEALADAARREAEVAGDRGAAARLLVRSATVRADRTGDAEGAVSDLERALELDPDHPQAADRLAALLIPAGKEARLAEVLGRAGASARDPERAAALFGEVARLQADHLGNLPGAISSLNRVLRTAPKHVDVLRRLAAYYVRDGQHTEAAHLLGRVVQLAPEREVLRDVHLELARLHADNLGQPDKAMLSLQAVLALDPGHPEALERVSRLQEAEGHLGAAAEAASKLVTVAPDDRARAVALGRLAQVELTRGRAPSAVKALVEAVSLEGPTGEAALELKRVAESADDWARYGDAVAAHLERTSAGSELRTACWLELARIRFDRLRRPDEAIATLRTGLDDTGGAPGIRTELAARLQMAGHHREAAAELVTLGQWDPARAEHWRNLAHCFDALGQTYEARLAREPLILLGSAAEGEVDAVQRVPPRTPRAAADALAGHPRALPRARHTEAAVQLLGVLADALPRLYPADLESYGLTTRDKVVPRQQHPIQRLAEHVAAILGGPEFDLYIHRVRSRGIAVEPGTPPALLVPAPVGDLPEAQQVFLLAQPLVLMAHGLHAVEKLTPRELEVFLAAACRTVDPAFGGGLTADDLLEDQGKRIHRSLPRRARRQAEEAVRGYLGMPVLDFQSFVDDLRRAAMRMAAVLSDDLASTVAVVQREDEELVGLSGPALLRRSGPVNDLVRFWLSEPALEVRRALGYLDAAG